MGSLITSSQVNLTIPVKIRGVVFACRKVGMDVSELRGRVKLVLATQ